MTYRLIPGGGGGGLLLEVNLSHIELFHRSLNENASFLLLD